METNISEAEEAIFNQLQVDAKNLASIGKIAESLKLFQEAYAINPTKKVKKRIGKLQALLEEYGEEIDESMVEVDDKFYLYHELYKKLYPYQKEGVKWLWNLFQKRKGGVLGDDMGLGKTIQIIAFLSGMFDMDAIKYVLVIMPVSLLPNWEKEFKKWTPGLSTYCFHGSSKRERERVLIKTQNRGGVLLTSYGMLVNNIDLLTSKDGREFVWDYMILDEAHKIKNPTKTTKAAHSIPARNRIALTGTPIQNNLRELWSLYDFVQQGTLLGSLHTFKMQYETPITRSREKDATAGERRLGTEIAESLIKLIQPYFLRRTKQEVLNQKEENNNSTYEGNLRKEFYISRKNDFIIWLYLCEKQIGIYKDFLELDRVKNILMTKRSPLVELTVLKKICDHPRLLSKGACKQLGLDGDIPDDTEDETDDYSAVSIENVTDEDLIGESGKLGFLLSLLSHLRETGHRTLLFSQSRKMLDIIHRILLNRNWKVIRIDGTINKIEERQKRIQLFQQDLSIPIFLLTTQVGGVGFTLTGADRVVIYDPSWNPATDAQAVDRAYRIGQDKNVVIYRLITCSTVEEKIYRRQIFKDSITRQATGGNKDPHRYFTKQELRELFTLENPYHSATQVQLEEMHASQRNVNASLDGHIAFLYSLNIFGISDHDLMFSSEQIDDDEKVLCDENMRDDYIRQRVETAQQLLSIESAMTSEDNAKSNIYARPYPIPTRPVKSNTTKDLYKPPTFPNIVDLNDINRSLQHMSFQEESVNIGDSSAVPCENPNYHVVDSELDCPVILENVKNGSVKSKENADESIIITDEEDNQGNQSPPSLSPSVIMMETSIKKRSRRSLLYVPESDSEEATDNSDAASREMFIPDSGEEGNDGSEDSPFCNQNEYRNKQISHDISQQQKVLIKQDKKDNLNNDFMSSFLQRKQCSESVPILIDDEDAQYSETNITRDSGSSFPKSSDIHCNREVPAISLSTACNDDANIVLPELEECKNKIEGSDFLPQTSLSTNQHFTSAFENNSEKRHFLPLSSTPIRNKVFPMTKEEIKSLWNSDTAILNSESDDIYHDAKEVPVPNLNVDETYHCKKKKTNSTPVKKGLLPMIPQRITPLRVPKLQIFSLESSSFQKALLQSKELDPAAPNNPCTVNTYIHNLLGNNANSPSSLNTVKGEKFQHDSLVSETSLRTPGTGNTTLKSEKFLQDVSMSEASYVSNEGSHSVARSLSYKFEQSPKHNESDHSPVRGVRKPRRQIIDSSDESEE